MTSRDRVPRAPSGSSHDNGQSAGLRRSNGFLSLRTEKRFSWAKWAMPVSHHEPSEHCKTKK
jgi:hypothetical protein